MRTARMWRGTATVVAALLLATALTTVSVRPAAADATSVVTDRSVAKPTSWWVYNGVDASFIANHTQTFGSRLAEIEVDSASPLKFTVRLVRNSGSFAAGWWWYYGQTIAQLNTLASNNSARIVDVDGYSTPDGVRYAAVMVSNSGSAARQWLWRVSSNPNTIFNELVDKAYRPLSAETFFVGSTKYYVVTAIKNSGADYKGWSWGWGRTLSNLQSSIGSQRLVDLQRHGDTYDYIAFSEPLGFWWYVHQFSSLSAVVNFAHQSGTRPISVDRHVVSGNVRYAAVFLNNVDAVTGGIRDRYWTNVGQNGSWGWALKQVNGLTLTSLQSTKQFEPASTLKVLYHLHALKQRQAGNVTDSTSVTFRYKATTANHNDDNLEGWICPDNYSNTATTNLRRADEQMMFVSDNRMTRAVTDKFGYSAITATGTAAGMTQTDINHNIGCGSPRNLTTARDINRIYEDVYENFSTLNSTQRALFRSRMGNDDIWGFHSGSSSSTTDGFCPVVRQEAAKVGKTTSTADAFCNATQWVAKGGSYSTSQSYPKTVSYSGGSLTSLPFKTSEGQIAMRHYAFTEFLDQSYFANSTVENKANTARTQAFYDALRPQIRAGLVTW